MSHSSFRGNRYLTQSKISMLETNFIQYLKLQKFSFKVPICCVEFSFNLTMAFADLFIGILSGFLKIYICFDVRIH